MIFRQLFDRDSCTYTYLLADPTTREALLIDPVRELMGRDLEVLSDLGLTLKLTLETHVHADHIAASGPLRARTGSKSVMSEDAGASCADHMLADGDTITLGAINIRGIKTPGHTDGCMSYEVTSHGEPRRVFTGDALLIRGCGRTDFQQGSPHRLFHSIREKLFSLPDDTLVFPAHDYKGRTVSTIGEEKAHNPRAKLSNDEDTFVDIMNNLGLAEPAKIDEAVPANLRCGLAVQSGEPDAATQGQWAPIEKRSDDVPEVSIEWTKQTLGHYRLIDVRESAELTGELPKADEAEHVALGTLGDVSDSWDRDEPLVLVCRSGNRSGKAALLLKAKGFDKVASVRGGMKAWHAGECG